jgi:tellurite resistance protein
MTMPVSRLPIVPGAFFGMVLGLGGLGGVWRVAHRVWGYPAWVGEALLAAAAVVWVAWIALYAAKWIWLRPVAEAEFNDPALSFGLGLVPMATMMASIALKSYVPGLAWWVFAAGLTGGILLTVWLIGGLWQGGRGIETVTPLMILPSVGTAYTGALAATALGYREEAAMLFGPGLVTWILMDSLILWRLMTHPLPPPLRPTIGIQLAPPSVGCLAYLGFAEGPPDKLVHFLLGYALLQVLILLRLNAWIRAHPFGPGMWAFTFGVAALAGSTLICLERQPAGFTGSLAWPLFILANLLIGWIALRTLGLAASNRLFPILQPAK